MVRHMLVNSLKAKLLLNTARRTKYIVAQAVFGVSCEFLQTSDASFYQSQCFDRRKIFFQFSSTQYSNTILRIMEILLLDENTAS